MLVIILSSVIYIFFYSNGFISIFLMQLSLLHNKVNGTFIPNKKNILKLEIRLDNLMEILIKIPFFLGQRIKRYKGHEGMVNSVAVARDDRPLIVSGGDDCQIKVWDRYK